MREAKEFRLIRTRQHGTDMSADAISMGAAKKKRDDEVLASLDETFTTKQNNVMSITDKRMFVSSLPIRASAPLFTL